MIKLLIPQMASTNHLIPWLRKIEANKIYTNFGPLSLELEEALSESLGVQASNICLLSSATLALELAIETLGLSNSSRILVPAFTFPATVTAILRCGHIPIFADVDEFTWNLTTEIALKCYEVKKFDAVLTVAAFGNGHSPNAWDKFSEANNLPVIIDAAGAFPNQSPCKNCLVIYSLHATKALPAGEGGVVVGPKKMIDQIKKRSNFGLEKRESINFGIVNFLGTNAKMSEYHSAVCLANYSQWASTSKKRRELHQKYISLISLHDSLGIKLQSRRDDGIYTIMPVLLPENIDVNIIASSLCEKGIETRRWYYPLVCQHPLFDRYELSNGLKNALEISSRLLGIPFHTYLKAEEQVYIVNSLVNLLQESKRLHN